MHPMLNIAIRAARKAGNVIIKYYEKSANIVVNQKNSDVFITNISNTVELIITNTIKKYYPEHTFCTNKKSIWKDNQDVQWIIDPLNGILNFIKFFPHFAISIAVRIKDRTEVAVIYDPIRNELFTAIRGQGAQLNNCRIHTRNIHNLDYIVLATGFPFKMKQKYAATYMNIVSKLLTTKCIDFRKTGSSALDLAYVAAGRINGYFEFGLNPWNFFAGELIAREAGALICDLSGGYNYFFTDNILAGAPYILKVILRNIHTER